jgi:hypothetical protein
LQAHAAGLGAFGELAADRVPVGGLGVVEDQRRGGEPLDGGRLPGAFGIRAHVHDFVPHDRANVELVVVDGQEHDAGFQFAATDAVGDRGGVAADQPQGDIRMAAQEHRDEPVDVPRRRAAEDADGDGAPLECGEFADGAGGVLDGAEAARGVLGERAAGLGEHDAPAGADEQIGAERLFELADLLRDRGL